ncbi:MAG: patatin-like protein [Actinomycetia bacterium]|nr:patatin-like protein [Actinomycetes bacterium]
MTVTSAGIPAAARDGDVKELRLALVCYGGVSLAVYMHGVTKELFKLAIASAAYEHDDEHNPFDASDTARVYYDLLARMQRGEIGPGPTGVRTRVVIDIVSGTSAGGINGICLAKALACNSSLDALKQLWMEKADVSVLMRGPRWMPTWLRVAGFGARSVGRMSIRPPLDGDHMCGWLHEAFVSMDNGPRPLPDAPTLVPDDHRLQLFVPITDFVGYQREVPIEDPHYLRERGHRHLMTFTFDSPASNQFDGGRNHVLAFAARATSSFPGAFAPITVGGYAQAVGDSDAMSDQLDEFFPQYALAGNHADASVFIDGGVLDNFPFASSIEAISHRAAASEVDRRLLYIEPDPSHATFEPAATAKVPSWIATVWGGIAGIPRQEPILDDLQHLADRNEVVHRVRDIIETSFTTISARVEQLLDGRRDEHGVEDAVALPDDSDGDSLARWRRSIDERVAREAGFAYATYLRLRILDVVDQFADAVASALDFPPTTYHAAFVRSILRAWVANDGLLEQSGSGTSTQQDFLSVFDLGYHQRRVRFLISAFSWWYGDCGKPGFPTRTELDSAKARMYARLNEIGAIEADLGNDPSITVPLARVFDAGAIRDTVLVRQEQASAFAELHASELELLRKAVATHIAARLPTIEAGIHAEVLDIIKAWSEPVKGAFLTRYMGFGFWDALVFPVSKLGGVGERDAVEVLRMSPRENTLLVSPDKQKLNGASLGHFGAFFSRRGRESDYLWGRLDAAERLIALLLDDPATPGLETPPPNEPALAFRAILDDERPTLTKARDLIKALDPQVTAMRASIGDK